MDERQNRTNRGPNDPTGNVGSPNRTEKTIMKPQCCVKTSRFAVLAIATDGIINRDDCVHRSLLPDRLGRANDQLHQNQLCRLTVSTNQDRHTASVWLTRPELARPVRDRDVSELGELKQRLSIRDGWPRRDRTFDRRRYSHRQRQRSDPADERAGQPCRSERGFPHQSSLSAVENKSCRAIANFPDCSCRVRLLQWRRLKAPALRCRMRQRKLAKPGRW
jgi:hypothetical protein